MWIISSCPKGLWNISYLTKPRIITSNDFCPRLILSAIDYLPTNFTKIRKIRGQTIVHITCNLYTAKGVLPSRQNYCNSFFRGLRPRLLSLRSVVPSRHLTHNSTKPSFNYKPLAGQFVSYWNQNTVNGVSFSFPLDVFPSPPDVFSFLIRNSLLQSL